MQSEEHTPLLRARAWAIHLFTASGVIPGLLAIEATFADDGRMALLWLGVALIIDGLDGPLARRFEVTRHTPRFDGAILDLVIDYLTYTAIPALMIWQLNMVPEGWGLAAASFVMVTALYCFGNRDMKTKDNYFEGFPATWNLVVLCFFILDSGQITNLAVIAFLGALTFTHLKFIHPFRVVRLRLITIFMTATWGLSSTWLLIAKTDTSLLESEPAAFAAWLFSSLYFVGFGIVRSFQQSNESAEPPTSS
ncbi:MAG: phosphatidylcholine synthase [Parvibaculum sp.]|jgi:phosphatidylcholine synthase|nr:phosphatidylcholine synthase [Parvibaculum sp.]|tara:strand:- start:247 stop:999 length:753 start_codon:yes stop_codon:yes gene_type:complete